jgi:polyisoprenoid-binding protein YceI
MRRIFAAWMSGLLLALTAPAVEAPAPSWGRIPLVEAELFGVDTAHSYVGFTIGFLGMTKVRGLVRSYSAAVLYDEKDPSKSSVTIFLDPASIDTGLEMRDKDLKGDRFFDVGKYPRMCFQSDSIERTGPDRYVVHGTLEIRGVKRPVALPMTQTVPRGPDSGWGNVRVGGSGRVTIKRTNFGISGGEFWGQKALSDEVELEIDILCNRFNFWDGGYDSREKPSIGEALEKTLLADGAAAAVSQYRELKDKHSGDYNFGAGHLTRLANRLLQRRQFQDALEIWKLAAEAAPTDTTIQARLGETYAALGDRSRALAFYRKVLELSPDNPEAIEMLRRLEKTSAR